MLVLEHTEASASLDDRDQPVDIKLATCHWLVVRQRAKCVMRDV
jgi:hypothetical protein